MTSPVDLGGSSLPPRPPKSTKAQPRSARQADIRSFYSKTKPEKDTTVTPKFPAYEPNNINQKLADHYIKRNVHHRLDVNDPNSVQRSIKTGEVAPAGRSPLSNDNPNGSRTENNKKPNDGGVDVTGGTEGTAETNATAPVQDAASAPPATPPTNKSDENKKKEDNGGFWKGYGGTKLGVGAALLAGGIALKLTLIGIVPGLIMAGAGAAIMAWGGINLLFNGKKDDAKESDKKDATPAASS